MKTIELERKDEFAQPENVIRDRNHATAGLESVTGRRTQQNTQVLPENLTGHDRETARPCFPLSASELPAGAQWAHEIQWDGLRVFVHLTDGNVVLRDAEDRECTSAFPLIAFTTRNLNAKSAVIDGEAVVLDQSGQPSLAELQADLYHGGSYRAVLYAFDLLFLDGVDFRNHTLTERRKTLASIIRPSTAVNLTKLYDEAPDALLNFIANQGFKGIISKRLDVPYQAGRRQDWLKTQCRRSGKFVVIGYQPRQSGSPRPIAKLKLARYEAGRLWYAGTVERGFSPSVGTWLAERLSPLRVSRCPIEGLEAPGVFWTKPQVHAAIAYSGVTNSWELRGASFIGLEN